MRNLPPCRQKFSCPRQGHRARFAKRSGILLRATPEHKRPIVNAMQANVEVAATTGNRINHVPPPRTAAIGVTAGDHRHLGGQGQRRAGAERRQLPDLAVYPEEHLAEGRQKTTEGPCAGRFNRARTTKDFRNINAVDDPGMVFAGRTSVMV
ncbi:hypothetical protein [Salipiger thiooxidans]|uniref:hypothetical protein n=1 Tax=Salipiger thiooxidans TaxID=282683 RepID=UPI001CD8116D|nr:hypothetical protein [Salipiger thiooxidans]MCA0848662.1 hypothetical protein [Salipiger thiooxidans]